MNDSELELYGIVGRMFKEIREEKGLSLTSVSEYLQIAPISLQRYECGERKIKTGTIKKLCIFYKIEYDDFIKEAKLRFSKNIFTDASSEKKEKEILDIMAHYTKLNAKGKEIATEQVRLLTLDEKYTKPDNVISMVREPEPDYLAPNAAHERTNKEFTEEERVEDDSMLD